VELVERRIGVTSGEMRDEVESCVKFGLLRRPRAAGRRRWAMSGSTPMFLPSLHGALSERGTGGRQRTAPGPPIAPKRSGVTSCRAGVATGLADRTSPERVE
jgi:hypothetical protein